VFVEESMHNADCGVNRKYALRKLTAARMIRLDSGKAFWLGKNRKGTKEAAMSITYFVVQSFQLGKKGVLIPDEPFEASSARAAQGAAARLAIAKAGALAFAKSGDPATGDYEDAIILCTHGLVPGDLMEMMSS
jgi:hypothetical protein